jgi:cholesterol oxidase
MSTVHQGEHYDAIVVGSGFGGAVSAYRLAEGGKRVCLLERGKAWAPGQFPRSPRELARNFWDPSEGLHGFFDVWTFKGTEVLVSSCLAGGSIIYANVFIRKDEHWFLEPDGRPWPVTRAALEPHYDNVERAMRPQRYPFDRPPYANTPKTRGLKLAAERLGVDWSLPLLNVTFANEGEEPAVGVPIAADEPNRYDVRRYTCRLCGECDIGCNFGSKNTLDLGYLSRFERLGGEVRTMCEVRRIEPCRSGGYHVGFVAHREGRKAPTEQLPLEWMSADRVVVAAGSLGSTYLLLRNRDALPGLSHGALGTRWCGNGDLLGFATRSGLPLDPATGPVITCALRYEGRESRGYYIEDGGWPLFITYLAEASDVRNELHRAARFGWRRLRQLRGKRDSHLSGELSELIGDGRHSAGVLPLLGMGRDVPDGKLTLEDGYLECDWTMETSRAYYEAVKRSMEDICRALGATFKDELLWYFKRTVTSHPVGGCPMGVSPADGVVDEFGQVFGHPGLAVVDGAVMPGPVGPNPSFTIAAFADRAAEWMLEDWSPSRPSRRG